MIIFVALSSLLVGLGLFLILSDLFRLPSRRTRSRMLKLLRADRKESGLDRLLGGISRFIGQRLPLGEEQLEMLKRSLRLANLPAESDEDVRRFLASCVVKGGLTALLVLPVGFLNSLGFVASPLVGVLAGYSAYRKVSTLAEKRQKRVEAALPDFVSYLMERLARERSVYRLLAGYREKASAVFREELDHTLADLSTGNEEEALRRFSARVPSPRLSMVIRGLIGVSRGDDMTAFWENLSLKMEEIRRQNVRRRAARFPKTVRRCSLLLLGCFLMTYLVVIGSEIISSLSGMFS